MEMKVDYNFVPEYLLQEQQLRGAIISYAGRLLELCDAPFVVVALDNDNKPRVYLSTARLVDALDFDLSF